MYGGKNVHYKCTITDSNFTVWYIKKSLNSLVSFAQRLRHIRNKFKFIMILSCVIFLNFINRTENQSVKPVYPLVPVTMNKVTITTLSLIQIVPPPPA